MGFPPPSSSLSWNHALEGEQKSSIPSSLDVSGKTLEYSHYKRPKQLTMCQSCGSGSGAFLTLDRGWVKNISESLETIFWDKYLNSFMRIQESFWPWIRDPRWKKIQIRYKHPESTTLPVAPKTINVPQPRLDDADHWPVLRIRIHMFLGLPDPDPLVRGMDPDPSIIMQK